MLLRILTLLLTSILLFPGACIAQVPHCLDACCQSPQDTLQPLADSHNHHPQTSTCCVSKPTLLNNHQNFKKGNLPILFAGTTHLATDLCETKQVSQHQSLKDQAFIKDNSRRHLELAVLLN